MNKKCTINTCQFSVMVHNITFFILQSIKIMKFKKKEIPILNTQLNRKCCCSKHTIGYHLFSTLIHTFSQPMPISYILEVSILTMEGEQQFLHWGQQWQRCWGCEQLVLFPQTGSPSAATSSPFPDTPWSADAHLWAAASISQESALEKNMITVATFFNLLRRTAARALPT